jgi:acetyltransferase-like isoleucine patch superfamily enzyme
MFCYIDKYSAKKILTDQKVKIGKNCDIETPLYFHNCQDFSKLSIGDNCHIGKNCFFDLSDEIMIKDNVIVSMQCTFLTHLDASYSKISKVYPKTKKPIIINNDSYLGANCTILMGVELGSCNLVSAGSVVIKSSPENSFLAGVPAVINKQIKF